MEVQEKYGGKIWRCKKKLPIYSKVAKAQEPNSNKKLASFASSEQMLHASKF